MASSMVVKVACLAVMMSMVLSQPLITHVAALTCAQVETEVASCVAYLRSGGVVPLPCCNGIRTLNTEAKTTPDRQAVCRCIKTTAQTLPGLNLDNLKGLPTKCGVDLPYELTPSIDCNKVQ